MSSRASDPSSKILSPPSAEPLPSSTSPQTYSSFTETSLLSPLKFRYASQVLSTAISSRRLGSLRAERDEREYTPFHRFVATFPVKMLLLQAFWSLAVTGFAFALSNDLNDDNQSTLSSSFWESKLNLTPSVVYGVGWALFVLLGFFIREAASRYREALEHWGRLAAMLKMVIRHMMQAYPRGVWHDGDWDRIIAFLTAYPIALKMHLRDEREQAQLASILHEQDMQDVVNAPSMHGYCMQVVRAYFSSAEVDSEKPFVARKKEKEPGFSPRYFMMDQIDDLDKEGVALERIKAFTPAVGYTFHLRTFLIIWLMFLPLAIVRTSGWFTALWSLLVTYGVGMLFKIAMHLNDPFGFDLEDIKLNRLAAEASLGVLSAFSKDKTTIDQTVYQTEPVAWLEKDVETGIDGAHKGKVQKMRLKVPMFRWIWKFLSTATFRGNVALPMFFFFLWVVTVVFLHWALAVEVVSADQQCNPERFWCLYVPLSTRTTAYVGLGIFLLLGFWISDAYARYKRGLYLWRVPLHQSLEQVAMVFCMIFKRGSFHPGDRQRIFSHLAALPYVAKQHLRNERNIDELRGYLSEQDWHSLNEAPNQPTHCLNIIHGYCSASDTLHSRFLPKSNPLYASRSGIHYVLYEYELAFQECEAMHKFPIPSAFTFHLRIFSGVWLIALPLAFVNYYSFFSFLFLLPVGYSIINLLSMGTELADPFGRDQYDIPIDVFCGEIRDDIHHIYRKAGDGASNLMHVSHYDRSSFDPCFWNARTGECAVQEEETWRTFFGKITSAFPSVNPWAQFTVILWSAAVVSSSYAFSFLWNETVQGDVARRDKCPGWCSPIDVDGSLLLELGFALFLILSFRASDALDRYDGGAEILSNIGGTLRNLSLEVVKHFDDGAWHEMDKERIVAHMAQLPLALRDQMLGITRVVNSKKEGLLSEEDDLAQYGSPDPVRHIINVLHSYIASQDCKDFSYRGMDTNKKAIFTISNAMQRRCYILRKLVAEAQLMKRFPVVLSYTRHQRVFTAVWLSLLPLAMTNTSGWLTILWAPLISYGILGLENIATSLVDPFGTDDIDLPVHQMATKASGTVVEAVNSVGWGCKYHVLKTGEVGKPFSGVTMEGEELTEVYSLPHFSLEKADVKSFGSKPVPNFKIPRRVMLKPTLFSHMLHSVPWWGLLGIMGWTTVALMLSYALRIEDESQRWWRSRIQIDSVVGSYVSFAAFMLLGFYVKAAFSRYNRAGQVWGDDLRAACHSIGAHFSTLAPEGSWHSGDRERIFGHIAALPVALKMELRDERDILELKGLLSQQDIGRIHCADNMATHCLDVLRSYAAMAAHHQDDLAKKFKFANRMVVLFADIRKLEGVIRACTQLRDVRLATGFIVMLRALLAIWFVLLPFILAEHTGWFSILWVTLIAYGVIGMYSVAEELQQPFGTDLNDLDLDELSNQIVEDILFVEKNYYHGVNALISDEVEFSGDFWVQGSSSSDTSTLHEGNLEHCEKKVSRNRWNFLWLLIVAVPWWALPLVAFWTTASVVLAYLIEKEFPISEDACTAHICSIIAINGPVKEYVGFALFLLLGLRLYDSHWRYVNALSVWREGIIGVNNMLSSRTFEGYRKETFHKGDLERIAAHLAGFVTLMVSKLRRSQFPANVLRKFMHKDDVAKLACTKEPTDYCLDVVRSYFVKGDYFYKDGKPHSISDNEALGVFYFLHSLRDQAAECEKMIRIPLPFGYIKHTRIFLVIWIALLPLGLVETQGWTTILWTLFIAYGLIGVEKWSQELSDPFGLDLSDIPMDNLREQAVQCLKNNLALFKEGTQSVIKTNRTPFPVPRALETLEEEP